MGFELFIAMIVTGTIDFWHFVACTSVSQPSVSVCRAVMKTDLARRALIGHISQLHVGFLCSGDFRRLHTVASTGCLPGPSALV